MVSVVQRWEFGCVFIVNGPEVFSLDVSQTHVHGHDLLLERAYVFAEEIQILVRQGGRVGGQRWLRRGLLPKYGCAGYRGQSDDCKHQEDAFVHLVLKLKTYRRGAFGGVSTQTS